MPLFLPQPALEEELILYSPYNYLNHLKYADVLYTIGGLENFKAARKYYSLSLELNMNENLPGLYGLWLSCVAVASCKGGLDDRNTRLLMWSSKQLTNTYKKVHNTMMLKVVVGMTSQYQTENK